MLRDLKLLSVYDSSDSDLIHDLIEPLLTHSKSYLRGVGFFTSGWLRIASCGVVNLIENGGEAQFVLSPIMEEQDWKAFQLGQKAKNDEWLKQVLKKNIKDLTQSLETDTINTLAWMIADEVLEFRFAVPRNNKSLGDYHDKVGIFSDIEGNIVAIHGSFNDTVKGSLNGEAFSVFKSWETGQQPYVKTHQDRLTKLFEQGNSQFQIFSISEAITRTFLKLRTSKFRPYVLPIAKQLIIDSYFQTPQCPVKLYPFQKTAISNWINSGCCGIFEMATGTGKTITSLAAAIERLNDLGKLAIIILVPYLHLLDQWMKVCRQFGFLPILCSGDHSGWQQKVQSKIQDLNIGAIKSMCIITVHKTAASQKFRKVTKRLPDKYTLLIGDEAHGLGTPTLRRALIPQAELRLGLSATPHRWFDEEGTETLFTYFKRICFEITIDQAIGKYLTPYTYNPIPVHLTADELMEFEELSQKISLLNKKIEKSADVREMLKRLLMKRARIIAGAEQKLPLLIGMLKNKIRGSRQNDEKIRGILIYCAPGLHKNVLIAVSNLGLKCHEFVHTVSNTDRAKILKQFTNGEIQLLVAVKCLDEGVDVPSTKTAFFLASTTNPKEFVQRRGRVLRLAEGKNKAELYDFIVVPEPPKLGFNMETGRALLRREMPRFAEFASSALNEFEARAIVRDILDQYEMLNLFDEKPWQIYHKLVQNMNLE